MGIRTENIKIKTEYIKLDQLLKWAGIAGTGTEAKYLIYEGLVKVNNQTVLQRGKKIFPGDEIIIQLEDEIRLIVEK